MSNLIEDKTYKSTIEAFISAKREIKAINKNAEAYKFKFADLTITQAEVNRVLENKGLDLIGMEHYENEHYIRDYIKDGKTKDMFVSIGTVKYTIGSIGDNEKLVGIIPANFANTNSEHDTVFSANSISYRYFLLRAFAIPTLDENQARKQDKEFREKPKEILKDTNGNIIGQPSDKQIQAFRGIVKNSHNLRTLIELEMSENNLKTPLEYILFKSTNTDGTINKKGISDGIGNNIPKKE